MEVFLFPKQDTYKIFLGKISWEKTSW